jgi:AP endonuclease-1
MDYLREESPDILCLQETKCSEKKLPPEAKVPGYTNYWLSGTSSSQSFYLKLH